MPGHPRRGCPGIGRFGGAAERRAAPRSEHRLPGPRAGSPAVRGSRRSDKGRRCRGWIPLAPAAFAPCGDRLSWPSRGGCRRPGRRSNPTRTRAAPAIHQSPAVSPVCASNGPPVACSVKAPPTATPTLVPSWRSALLRPPAMPGRAGQAAIVSPTIAAVIRPRPTPIPSRAGTRPGTPERRPSVRSPSPPRSRPQAATVRRP